MSTLACKGSTRHFACGYSGDTARGIAAVLAQLQTLRPVHAVNRHQYLRHDALHKHQSQEAICALRTKCDLVRYSIRLRQRSLLESNKRGSTSRRVGAHGRAIAPGAFQVGGCPVLTWKFNTEVLLIGGHQAVGVEHPELCAANISSSHRPPRCPPLPLIVIATTGAVLLPCRRAFSNVSAIASHRHSTRLALVARTSSRLR